MPLDDMITYALSAPVPGPGAAPKVTD
jgi:hypothetical protein